MTIDEELRRLDPAADLPSYTDAELETMMRAARGRRHARPWIRWASVAAALVLAVALTVNSIGGNPQQAAAAETLRHAARALPTDTAEPWQYIKVTEYAHRAIPNAWPDKEEYPDAWFLVDYTWTKYVSVDPTRNGLLIPEADHRPVRQVYGPPTEFLASAPWVMFSSPETAPPNPADLWNSPTMDFLASLPTDNDALRAELYAGLEDLSADEADAAAFHRVNDLLITGLVPPDLSAQLYEILATMPGIRQAPEPVRIGDLTGVAIGHVGRPHDGELVFLEDGRLLGERGVWNPVDWGLTDGGETVETYSIRSSEIVDELPTDLVAIACATDEEHPDVEDCNS